MLRQTLTKLQAPLRAGVVRSLSVSAPTQEKYINRVQLLGRVGNDPEERGDMRPIVYFPVATTHTVRISGDGGDESFSDGPSTRNITTWHNVIVGQPSFRKYVKDFLKKGCRVLVEGSLSYYKATTKDGADKITATIKANDLIILAYPKTEEEAGEYQDDSVYPEDTSSDLR